jgi:hypothetical protein
LDVLINSKQHFKIVGNISEIFSPHPNRTCHA